MKERAESVSDEIFKKELLNVVEATKISFEVAEMFIINSAKNNNTKRMIVEALKLTEVMERWMETIKDLVGRDGENE